MRVYDRRVVREGGRVFLLCLAVLFEGSALLIRAGTVPDLFRWAVIAWRQGSVAQVTDLPLDASVFEGKRHCPFSRFRSRNSNWHRSSPYSTVTLLARFLG